MSISNLSIALPTFESNTILLALPNVICSATVRICGHDLIGKNISLIVALVG